MPRAIHRILHHHDTGGALKRPTDIASFNLDSRKRVPMRQSFQFSYPARLVPFVLGVFSILFAFSSGCASRKPIADRRQPPPAQPTETSPASAEAAKRSTDVPEAPAPPPTV